ncbi:MAG: hypothetical protein QG553_731 [Patescibacteria group bacterium]|nr:hypothetical protein [Patescibacteria group bacterium]
MATKKPTKKSSSKNSTRLGGRFSSLSGVKKFILLIVLALLLSLLAAPLYSKWKTDDMTAKAMTLNVPAASGDGNIKFGLCFFGSGPSELAVRAYYVKPGNYSKGITTLKYYDAGNSGNPGTLLRSQASSTVWWGNEVKGMQTGYSLKANYWIQVGYTGVNGDGNAVSARSATIFFGYLPPCL